MKINNKIVLMLAIAVILFPAVKIQAEESGTGATANAEVKTNVEFRRDVDSKGRPSSGVTNPEFEGDHPRLPPPMPLKNKSGEKADVGAIRSGIMNGKMKPVNDDGTGPKKPESGIMGQRLDAEKAKMNNRPEMSAEAKAEFKLKADARRAEIKAKITERKGEIKKKLEDKAKERVKTILGNVFKRLTNQIEKLTSVDTRLDAKIDALQAKGIDVTLITAQQVIAQTALAKAKVDVEATSSLSVDQADTETSKETLRSLVKTAEDSIKAAGAEYRKVIALMPKEAPKAEVEAETSTSTTVGQ